ncbi:amidohydrolase [Virgisporangium aliadipatigenens]|uniref:amidohydrolase n=1 Tax=Virgisporangium aliadipatigenens TaxID=741659 RepID=UPI00194248FD|nr:amidohydrolase family protein [Virgisporangium aliadipatigenens]
MTRTTLYRGGPVYSPADPTATALLVDDDRIAWLGPAADAPTADTVVDLDGALVTPAFVDAHVHTTSTGLTLRGLDLAGTRSAAEVLERVSAFAATLPPDAVVLGHGWDESRWPSPVPPAPGELDRAAAGRPVYLSRADVHSAVVSSALLSRVNADRPGHGADGWLRRDAHHDARTVALASVSAAQRGDAQRAFLAYAAALGIAAVHECAGPVISSEEDLTGLLKLTGGPAVYGYWGELGAAAKARDLGAVGAGGDLFADGAFGSHTAHLRKPYLDRDTSGHGYLTPAQVADHLVDCQRHGVQGGFHAIGDAALSTVLAGFAMAAARTSVDAVRAARHRVEHAELLDKALIGGLVEFGIVASVQPAFDRLWGGAGAMYATRLGAERALATNPFGAMAGVGVALAFGSDSPVTPLDPWGAVRAAASHHNPVQRLGVRQAFAAHTRGGWRAVGDDAHGVLAPGAPATFALWRDAGPLVRGLPAMDAATPACAGTVLRGVPIHGEVGALR